jgi:hypothetical protein
VTRRIGHASAGLSSGVGGSFVQAVSHGAKGGDPRLPSTQAASWLTKASPTVNDWSAYARAAKRTLGLQRRSFLRTNRLSHTSSPVPRPFGGRERAKRVLGTLVGNHR